MLKYLFLLFFCFISVHAFAQNKLEITHLTGDFYIYTTYNNYKGALFPANGMYVVADSGVIMIDSPWDTTQAQPLLDSIMAKHNKKVLYCVATHFHDDRTGSFDIFKRNGVKTISSEQTYKLCKEKNSRQAEFYFRGDVSYNDAGIKLETFYPGWGHTEDNIVIWFPDSKILYGGCFIKSTESNGLGNLADADTKSWEKAVEKVMNKYPLAEFIIPGHQGWLDRGSLKYTYELLKEANGIKKGKNYKEDQFKDK